jgi:hypothetical protein
MYGVATVSVLSNLNGFNYFKFFYQFIQLFIKLYISPDFAQIFSCFLFQEMAGKLEESNWDQSLKIFSPSYSQSPLLRDFHPPLG